MISVAVQHHPARAYLLEPLLALLPSAEVVSDPEPEGKRSAWRTYRVALERTPPDADFRLIIQDDVRLARNFLPAARLAVAAHPEDLVAFYLGADHRENIYRVQHATARGERYVEVDTTRWVPVVALCWPAELAACLLGWVDEQGWPPEFVADDEIVGRFSRACGVRCFATCPSLVEHTDAPSVGRRPHISNDGRRAAFFIGDDDPLALDWKVR